MFGHRLEESTTLGSYAWLLTLGIVGVIKVGWLVLAIVIIALLIAGYLGVVTAALPIDVNVGRRVRPLGPQTVEVAAPSLHG